MPGCSTEMRRRGRSTRRSPASRGFSSFAAVTNGLATSVLEDAQRYVGGGRCSCRVAAIYAVKLEVHCSRTRADRRVRRPRTLRNAVAGAAEKATPTTWGVCGLGSRLRAGAEDTTCGPARGPSIVGASLSMDKMNCTAGSPSPHARIGRNEGRRVHGAEVLRERFAEQRFERTHLSGVEIRRAVAIAEQRRNVVPLAVGLVALSCVVMPSERSSTTPTSGSATPNVPTGRIAQVI